MPQAHERLPKEWFRLAGNWLNQKISREDIVTTLCSQTEATPKQAGYVVNWVATKHESRPKRVACASVSEARSISKRQLRRLAHPSLTAPCHPSRPTLLDVPISYFDSALARVPSQQTTLRCIATTSHYRPLIEQIRAETDVTKQGELKKQLPAITPVALLHHRKRDAPISEQVSRQWPMLMGDVDAKDNPDVDMLMLKAHLARLPYILLCAESVRGGLWFVARLPDEQNPDTLTAHFRYLQWLFKDWYGVTLDKGKGGNPTQLRYVSYDPAPYFNDEATLMHRTATTSPPIKTVCRKTFDLRGDQTQDDTQLLTRLIGRVEAGTDGNRHTTLLKESRLAGGYIAAGRMDEQTAVYALETVASEWPDFRKSQGTIRDGIRYGLAAPVFAEVKPPILTEKSEKTQCRYVRTFADWIANPGTVLRPNESQLTRLSVDTTDHYPPEWDAPNEASDVPTIKVRSYAPT